MTMIGPVFSLMMMIITAILIEIVELLKHHQWLNSLILMATILIMIISLYFFKI